MEIVGFNRELGCFSFEDVFSALDDGIKMRTHLASVVSQELGRWRE